MPVTKDKASETFYGVAVGVPLDCNMECFDAAHVYVYYGENQDPAVYGPDFDVILQPDDYDTFQVLPLAGLLNKITTAGAENVVYVKRRLPYTNDYEATDSFNREKTENEFARAVMRDQQLRDELAVAQGQIAAIITDTVLNQYGTIAGTRNYLDVYSRGEVNNIAWRGGAKRNILDNADFSFNQRMGLVTDYGRRFVLKSPFRNYYGGATYLRNPDNTWENIRSRPRHFICDRWRVYAQQIATAGGAGYIEHVRAYHAPEWEQSKAYLEGQLVAAPSGGGFGGFGIDGTAQYVYRAIRAHTSTTSWDNDVKATVGGSNFFQAQPLNWALAGILETDPALVGKWCIRWVCTTPPTGPSGAVWLEQRSQDLQRLIGGGPVAMSITGRLRSGAASMLAIFDTENGVGQSDYSYSTAAQSWSATGARKTFNVTIADPNVVTYDGNGNPLHQNSGFPENGRVSFHRTRFYMLADTGPFDLLLAEPQTELGVATPFQADELSENMQRCLTYFEKSNYHGLPARISCYIGDAVSGTPQYNTKQYDDIHDVYGMIFDTPNRVINWGAGSPLDRAFHRNETEFPNTGQVSVKTERVGKVEPTPPYQRFNTPKVRPPQVYAFDTISAKRGWATNNTRFTASLKWSHTGAGATARTYAQRALVGVSIFGVTNNGVDFRLKTHDEAEYFDNFSTSNTFDVAQDSVQPNWPGLIHGQRYDWDWKESASGTNEWGLVLDDPSFAGAAGQSAGNIQYYLNGVLTRSNDFVAGAFAVGVVVRIAGTYRYYICGVAGTYGSVDDNTFGWAPYGRITMPYSMKHDGGSEIGRSAIGTPGSLTAGQWAFVTFTSVATPAAIDFKTVLTCMTSGAADPGSAPDRVVMQSYDGPMPLYHNALFHWIADAEPLAEEV